MKTTCFKAICIVLCTFLISCKSGQRTVKNETEIIEYCNGDDYFTNNKAFRFTAIGQSMDQMISKKIAINQARIGIASQIQVSVNALITDYAKQAKLNLTEALMQRYEETSRQYIEQNLSGARVVCNRVTQLKDGSYKNYVCLELPVEGLIEPLQKQLSQDNLLRIDYNYEKFKEELEKEMEKRGREQKVK